MVIKGQEIFEGITLKITKYFLYYHNSKNGKTIKKSNTLTLEQIRKQFKEINYTRFYLGEGGRSHENEILEKILLPPFCFLFYYLLIIYERIPTPQEFVEKYIEMFFIEDKKGYRLKEQFITEYDDNKYNIRNRIFTYKQILGRVCRAYNAFNREIDLMLQLFQEPDIETYYSFQDDYMGGIDITVTYNNRTQTIGCYQKTKNGEHYFERKHTVRRKTKVDIEFPLTRKNTMIIGDIWLYSKKSVKELIEEKIKGVDENE